MIDYYISPVGNFLFWILGIVLSSLISFLIAKKYYDKSIPLWASRSTMIINCRNRPRITLFYDNIQQEKIILSKIAIWNKGNKTLNKDDISKRTGLSIKKSNEEGKILDSFITYQTKTANAAHLINLDENTIGLGFEYLDQNDGIVIEVLHTGEEGDYLELVGDIKGCKSKYINYTKAMRSVVSIIISFIATTIFMAGFYSGYSTISSLFSLSKLNIKTKIESIMQNNELTAIILIILFQIIAITFFIIQYKEIFLLRRIPKQIKTILKAY